MRRQGKPGPILQLIEQAKTEGLFTAKELLQLSHLCREGPFAHQPACKAALTAALQCMRSGESSPPMDSLAEVSHPCFPHKLHASCAPAGVQGFPYCGAAAHVLRQGLPTYGHAGRGESPLHPPGIQPVSKHWMEVCLIWGVQRRAHQLESSGKA